MRNDLTEIVMVVDRSYSMRACKADAEAGINQFIKKQRELPGEARLTVIQFDDKYDVVYNGVPIKDVGGYTLTPRGNTRLLDALGRTINDTGSRLAAMPESERPGLVCVVITTDGQENDSQEFTSEKIKEMISHQEQKYSWKFTYLGANQDAFVEGGAIGIARAATANYSADKCLQAYNAASNNVGRMRATCYSGQAVRNEYTPDEIRDMM